MNIRATISTVWLSICVLMFTPERPAGAYFLTGNDLFKSCTADDRATKLTEGLYCLGIILGHYDMMKALKYKCGDDKEKTAKQIKDVVVKYLKEHPAERSKPAGTISLLAIIPAFECTGPPIGR